MTSAKQWVPCRPFFSSHTINTKGPGYEATRVHAQLSVTAHVNQLCAFGLQSLVVECAHDAHMSTFCVCRIRGMCVWVRKDAGA